MSSGRRSPPASAKLGLFASAALLTLAAGPAWSQAVKPAPDDGLAMGELYLEADKVARDSEAKVTTASGAVEARYNDRTLRADVLTYDQVRRTVRVAGDVAVLNADGTAEFADEIVFDEDLRAGVAKGFSARLEQNVKLSAATAVRRSETVNELNRAIYTPCDICADGKSKTPTWSIAADKVVQDKERQLVHYRNATVRMFGAPVLWLPVFWHPDPQAVRKSGFLPPKFSASDRRGFSYEQPYLFVLSPHADLTLSPQLNTKVNPFLNTRYRRRFYSGEIDLRGGYTYDSDFDGGGEPFGEETSRSYILGRGAFRINEDWRWGFTAERTSDDLLFDKYEVGDVYETRGPFIADDRRLISQVYAIRQTGTSYASAAAFTIQGLRPGDIDRTFPVVAPLVESRFDLPQRVAGGRLRLRGSAVALTREQAPVNAAFLRTAGLDSRRVTGEVDWRSSYTAPAGLRLEPFVHLRADAYSLGDLPAGSTADKAQARALATAGLDLSYPLYRRFADKTVVLEPLLQFAASPDVQQIRIGQTATGEPIYLDEDSLAFEFDETNLMRPNKFPGYDLYEDGLRANVGGRASVLWDDGRRASLTVGRSFRAEENDAFPARTGLRDTASDWIVAADAQPMKGVSLFGRARLDGDTGEIQRAEAGANVVHERGVGYFRYLRDDLDINGVKRENLDLGGEFFVTENWGVSAYGSRDLVQGGWVVRDLGVVYRDECTRIDVIYRKEDTVLGRLGPSESITIRLTLATLGEPIYAR